MLADWFEQGSIATLWQHVLLGRPEDVNVLGLWYMTLVAIDGNDQFWPISHTFTFVFEEERAL